MARFEVPAAVTIPEGQNPLLVDSHCHLNFPDFEGDLDTVIQRARAHGVRVMQTICTEMAEFDEIYAIAERYEGVYCSVGVHPNDSAKAEVPTLEELMEKTRLPKVIGIGETGLDFHYENSPRERQIESFLVHIECARQSGLPLIVHSRDADKETAEILTSEMKRKPFRGLIHCFSTTSELSDAAQEIGMPISIAGIITFKNAQQLRDIVVDIPVENLIVETDSPFLAPLPYRGKRNEPAFTYYVNKMIADLKGVSQQEMAKASTDNFFRLFSKAKRPD